MFGVLSLRPRCQLRPETFDYADSGSGSYGGGSSYSGGGYTPPYVPPAAYTPPPSAAAPAAAAPRFDVSPASIQAAAARGNSVADIQSAYQTFLTGTPVGRGGQYAQSAQKKYGYASIRDAAVAYLDAAGLRRLAEVFITEAAPQIQPETASDDSGTVTQGPNETTGEGNPFSTVADLVGLFERVFAQGGETESPAPVVVVGDTTEGRGGGGSSVGIILVVLAIGAGAFYWFYLRKRNG